MYPGPLRGPPNFGSYEGGPNDVGVLDYDLPGNVSQTSTAANTGLFSTYSPQAFSSSGCGVTLNAVYTGPRTWATAPYGNVTTTWTSGAINSYNHISFPTAGPTDWKLSSVSGPNRVVKSLLICCLIGRSGLISLARIRTVLFVLVWTRLSGYP